MKLVAILSLVIVSSLCLAQSSPQYDVSFRMDTKGDSYTVVQKPLATIKDVVKGYDLTLASFAGLTSDSYATAGVDVFTSFKLGRNASIDFGPCWRFAANSAGVSFSGIVVGLHVASF